MTPQILGKIGQKKRDVGTNGAIRSTHPKFDKERSGKREDPVPFAPRPRRSGTLQHQVVARLEAESTTAHVDFRTAEGSFRTTFIQRGFKSFLRSRPRPGKLFFKPIPKVEQTIRNVADYTILLLYYYNASYQ